MVQGLIMKNIIFMQDIDVKRKKESISVSNNKFTQDGKGAHQETYNDLGDSAVPNPQIHGRRWPGGISPYKYSIESWKKWAVKNNSEVIDCDFIICNSDPPNVYNNLIKSREDYDFLFKQKMKRMDYSMGLFVYYFGSKKKYNDVAHHTIYFGEAYEKHLNNIFEKKILSDDISYYLHRPSATDPNMAPDGQDAFYVLVPVPNNLSKVNWIKEGDKFKEMV